METSSHPRGPLDPLRVPRFAGPSTFARLPRLDEVERADVAVLGVPFDSGTTYRPGARFGPIAVRNASRLLRGYHPGLDVEPFRVQQVADAEDVVRAVTERVPGETARFTVVRGSERVVVPVVLGERPVNPPPTGR